MKLCSEKSCNDWSYLLGPGVTPIVIDTGFVVSDILKEKF